MFVSAASVLRAQLDHLLVVVRALQQLDPRAFALLAAASRPRHLEQGEGAAAADKPAGENLALGP